MSTTENSQKLYKMKWTDNVGNVNVRMVDRPEVISFYFEHCNILDIHNHFRQYCLKLEKKWITFDPPLHNISRNKHCGHLLPYQVPQLPTPRKKVEHCVSV